MCILRGDNECESGKTNEKKESYSFEKKIIFNLLCIEVFINYLINSTIFREKNTVFCG